MGHAEGQTFVILGKKKNIKVTTTYCALIGNYVNSMLELNIMTHCLLLSVCHSQSQLHI